MIIETKPLSLAEARKIVDTVEDKEEKTDIKSYFKKFSKLKETDAKKLREELEALEMMKIKSEHIVKIIDLIPEDSSDINKIFTDTSLNEDEINKILEVIKKYK